MVRIGRRLRYDILYINSVGIDLREDINEKEEAGDTVSIQDSGPG